MGQLFLLDELARHPGGHGGLAGRDDDPNPGVAPPSHRPTPRVHHEADEEAVCNKSHDVRIITKSLTTL